MFIKTKLGKNNCNISYVVIFFLFVVHLVISYIGFFLNDNDDKYLFNVYVIRLPSNLPFIKQSKLILTLDEINFYIANSFLAMISIWGIIYSFSVIVKYIAKFLNKKFNIQNTRLMFKGTD